MYDFYNLFNNAKIPGRAQCRESKITLVNFKNYV